MQRPVFVAVDAFLAHDGVLYSDKAKFTVSKVGCIGDVIIISVGFHIAGTNIIASADAPCLDVIAAVLIVIGELVFVSHCAHRVDVALRVVEDVFQNPVGFLRVIDAARREAPARIALREVVDVRSGVVVEGHCMREREVENAGVRGDVLAVELRFASFAVPPEPTEESDRILVEPLGVDHLAVLAEQFAFFVTVAIIILVIAVGTAARGKRKEHHQRQQERE